MTDTSWPPILRDGKSAPFFDAAANAELLIKRCEQCEQLLPPESAVCTSCGGTDLTWQPAAGTGRVVSWTDVHRAPNRAYGGLVPYIVGIVELDEGPWLYARIEADVLHVDQRVRARFEHPDEGESYPVFEAVS